MKIVTISDSPTLFSGLARVHRHVIDSLVEAGHSVLPCGWFAMSDEQIDKIRKGESVEPISYKSTNGDIRILNVPKKNGFNNMYAIYDVIAEIKPDVVITIGDPWDFYYMRAIKIKTSFSFNWIAYLTVEHDELDDNWISLLKYADEVVCPSRFGQKAIEVIGKSVSFLPYGTEDVFKRMPERDRKSLRRTMGIQDKIRFITVAQNTWRKNLPALLQAVAHIRHRDLRHQMEFYIHTNVDADTGRETYLYDLEAIVRKLGIEEWVKFPESTNKFSIFSSPGDEAIAKEYNAADFFVSSSTCEGYGLPIVEAMACGLPAILHASSTSPEHLGAATATSYGWCPRGYLVRGKQEICPPARMLWTARPEAIGEALWQAFSLAKETKDQGRLERMRASCEEYGKGRTWLEMKKQLEAIVRRVAGTKVLPVEEI